MDMTFIAIILGLSFLTSPVVVQDYHAQSQYTADLFSKKIPLRQYGPLLSEMTPPKMIKAGGDWHAPMSAPGNIGWHTPMAAPNASTTKIGMN